MTHVTCRLTAKNRATFTFYLAMSRNSEAICRTRSTVKTPLDPWFCTAFGTAGPPELSMGPFRVTQPNPTHGSTQPMDNSEAHPGPRNQCNASVYRRYGRTKCFVVKTASLLYKFTPGCSLKANGLLKSSEIWVAGYGYILRLASVLNRCFDLFFFKKAESTCSGLQ